MLPPFRCIALSCLLACLPSLLPPCHHPFLCSFFFCYPHTIGMSILAAKPLWTVQSFPFDEAEILGSKVWKCNWLVLKIAFQKIQRSFRDGEWKPSFPAIFANTGHCIFVPFCHLNGVNTATDYSNLHCLGDTEHILCAFWSLFFL